MYPFSLAPCMIKGSGSRCHRCDTSMCTIFWSLSSMAGRHSSNLGMTVVSRRGLGVRKPYARLRCRWKRSGEKKRSCVPCSTAREMDRRGISRLQSPSPSRGYLYLLELALSPLYTPRVLRSWSLKSISTKFASGRTANTHSDLVKILHHLLLHDRRILSCRCDASDLVGSPGRPVSSLCLCH